MDFEIFVPTARKELRSHWKDYEDILTVKYNNSEHLCRVYNEAIENGLSKGIDYLILSHDDIRIEDKFIFEKLEKGFKKFDIIGIAGQRGKAPKIPQSFAPPAFWDSGNCQHTNRVSFDFFGQTPSQCVFLDGCFLAVAVNRLKGLRFDEDFPANGMEKYDVDFTLNATVRHGLKCGTWPIWLRHDSEGVSGDGGWEKHELCREFFEKKWKFPSGKGFK
jgi:hypothetical protein